MYPNGVEMETNSCESTNNYTYDLHDANSIINSNVCDKRMERFLTDQSTLCAFGDYTNDLIHRY